MAKKQKNPKPIDPQLIKDEINRRAYEISINRGIGGDAFSDWLQAEREIFQKYNIQKPKMEIKMMKDRKQYIDKISAQLKDWDDEINKLKTKVETVKAGSKEKYKELLNDYSAKKEAAQKKILELKNSSEDSWEELKKGSEIIWKDLKKTSTNVISNFR
jgi:GrpB-like predicted nucleotidyltransferase (UPF0157 family)